MTDASDMPYWQTAQTYFEAGWSPIPLPFKQKSPVPDDVTGGSAPYVSAEQVARWVGRKNGQFLGFRGRPEQARAGNLSFMPGNIALRMPMNVVGIDVDLYDGKAGAETLADAERRWGSLPPTWISTSRRDGSGIRYYQVPEGLKWRDLGPGVETIKWYHRYAIVMPSVHDKTAKRYIWITPDDVRVTDEFPAVDELPMLPAQWVTGLTEGQEYTGSGDAGDIDYDSAKEWLTEYGAGDMCSVMEATYGKYELSVRSAKEDGGAHDQARDGAWAILRDAAAGHTGAEEAIRQLGSVFGKAVSARRGPKWVGEWRRAVIKGVGKVKTEFGDSAAESDPCDMFGDTVALPARASGGSSAFDFKLDDIGNAQRLGRAIGMDARWLESYNSWVTYDPATALWRVDGGNAAIVRTAISVVRKMDQEAAFIEDPKSLAAFRAHIKASGGVGRIEAMIKIARSLTGVTIRAEALNANHRALHVANGVVVLGRDGASFRVRVHSDMATFATPGPYEAGARSPVWDRFLAEVLPDPDHRRWAQTLFGYSLLGGNPERAYVIVKGQSTSGKSTIMEAVATVLGDYASSYNAQMFRDKRDEGPRVDILDALSKRFIYTIEQSGEAQLHADLLKRATGNDKLRARGMNSNVYVEGVPQFTPWVATNAYPNIPGADKALHRRLYAVPFDQVILEPDVTLGEKLAAPEVQAAILAWLVEGWDIYCEDGLTKPSVEAMDARQEAISALSLFSAWLAEACEEGPESEGYVVSAEDLRLAWVNWLLENGHDESRWHTRQWFAPKMSGHGFDRAYRRIGDRIEDRKVYQWLGLRLRATGRVQ